MNNKAYNLILLTFLGLMLTSAPSLSDDGATSNGIYNPRAELEYSYRGTLERQEEQNREEAFNHYQQQQYLEQERQMVRQDMYNQTYQKKASDY